MSIPKVDIYKLGKFNPDNPKCLDCIRDERGVWEPEQCFYCPNSIPRRKPKLGREVHNARR